jgi:hypothetical protein
MQLIGNLRLVDAFACHHPQAAARRPGNDPTDPGDPGNRKRPATSQAGRQFPQTALCRPP